MEKAEDSHQEVHHGRNEEACRHEAAYVAVVGDETVDELAYGIYEEKSRAYKSQLARGKDTIVNQRLLHHSEAQSADII